jgi:DNA polymerase-3 subunit beta
VKFFCKKQELEKAALIVQRSVPIKPTSNIPEGIFLKSKSDYLLLRGYNLEFGITTKIKAKVESEGEIVLGAKIFSEIAKKSPGPTIEIEVFENFVAQIISEQSKFSLAGINPKLYPESPETQVLEKISIGSLNFRKMIDQTIFSVATSSSNNPTYTGVLFDVRNKKLKLVAIDGYRMAIKEEGIETEKTIKFIVPAKSLYEVLKLLPENKGETDIIVDTTHVLFDLKEYQLTSRLIEGNFLDYESSTPKTYTTEVELSPELLANSVERVSLMTIDSVKMPVVIVFKDNTVKVFCTATSGRASDKFSAQIEGEPLEIGLNDKYLLEALKNTRRKSIKLQFDGPLSPVKIIPEKGSDFMFLILPVRLKTSQEGTT